MELFGKNLDKDLVVIAEIGVNHEGSKEKAFELLELAAGAGADAVKFQSYTPEKYVGAIDPDRQERVRRFALDEAAHRSLSKRADELGVHFFSTPLSEDWVPIIAEIGSALKIASGDLTFEPVIRAAAKTGLPMIISVGLGTFQEVDQAVQWCREEIGDRDLPNRLALLHCVVAYPTPNDDANVSNISVLQNRYGLTVGYSNHVIGPTACYAAVAMGAPILEVHFTDQKTGRDFRDHALSMETDELRRLIENAWLIKRSLGTPGHTRQKSEVENLTAARKGIVAADDLSAGTILTESKISYARPAEGFASTEKNRVLGLSLVNPVTKGMPIFPDDVSMKSN